MLKEGLKKYAPHNPFKQFQMSAPPSDTPYIETRKGNIYPKLDVTEEYQKERDIRECIKQELREFFYDDMIANPQRVENMIDKLRESKWESINDIPDQYILDIDKCELIIKEYFSQKLYQQRSRLTPNEHVLIENLLYSKYKQSLENFRIEINYNVAPTITRYEKKLKFKNHQPNPSAKERKPYWNDYELDYDFNNNQSDSSQDNADTQLSEQQAQKQRDQEKLEEFYIAQVLGLEVIKDTSSDSIVQAKTISQDKDIGSLLNSKKQKSDDSKSLINGDQQTIKLGQIINKQSIVKQQEKEEKVILVVDDKKCVQQKKIKLSKKEADNNQQPSLLQKRTLQQMTSLTPKYEVIEIGSSSATSSSDLSHKSTLNLKNNRNEKNNLSKSQIKLQQKISNNQQINLIKRSKKLD